MCGWRGGAGRTRVFGMDPDTTCHLALEAGQVGLTLPEARMLFGQRRKHALVDERVARRVASMRHEPVEG